MKDKVVIITGGSRGYGAGIAKVLKAHGAHVWITGRDQQTLEAAAAELGVQGVQADVTSPADWDALFEQVMQRHGRVDLLINNAGGAIAVAPLSELSDDAIEQCIAVNLTGALYGARRAARVMKQQGSGMIINISSGCALHAWPGWAPYSAAKAGLNQFAHCLYTELREFGIRVTTITPYWGATEFVAAAGIEGHPAGDPEVRKKIMQPEEMGKLVLDLHATPAHLVIPDLTVQPLIQQIEPM